MKLLFTLWALLALFSGGVLMSLHQPFRSPETFEPVLRTLPAGRWGAVHLLAADCSCSRRVMRHLAVRGPYAGITEKVVVIGDLQKLAESRGLTDRGFQLSDIDPESAARDWGLKGVPLLILRSPQGRVAYAGGYGMSGTRDDEIWSALQRGETPAPLPIIGCAIGRTLRRSVDPWSWKYLSAWKE